MAKLSLIVFLVFSWVNNLICSPASDLGSPEQEVRDAAANILRDSYVTPARTNSGIVIDAITNGMPKTVMLQFLSFHGVTNEWTMGINGWRTETYRLNDAWVLQCRFSSKDDNLVDRKVIPSIRSVWLAPSTNFSGTWVTYWVNGQKYREINYDAGKYHGKLVAYNSDGSKCYEQNYEHHVAEGADTGYYPSGRINYRGIHKAGKQVGTWVWYNEDGTIKSTADHSK